MAEDFTTFTLVGSRINVVSATKYEFNDVGRNHTTYLYKDYGRHYFDDFEIENDSILTDIDNNGTSGGAFFTFAVAGNTNEIYEDPWAYGGVGGYWSHDVSPWDISFRIVDEPSGNNDTCGSVVTNTRYYFTYERSATTLTCKIYTDAARTALHDTLTIQTTDRPLSVLYAGGNRHGSAKSRFWGDTQNLDIISTTGSYSTPDSTGAEDFTTFSVTCSGTEIEVESAIRATANNIRRNKNNFCNKDYGAGYFTDFKHSVNSSVTNVTEQVNDGGSMIPWCVSNENGLIGFGAGWAANGGQHVAFGLSGDTVSINLYDWGNTNSDSYTPAYMGAIYYFDIERNNTTMTCKIYEDDDRTVLIDTLTIVCENTAWRYVYASSVQYSSSARHWTSGWTEYLKFNELSTPTNPGVGGPTDAASNAEWPDPVLNVDVEDQPGSSVTVCFYDGSDDSLIGCVEDVHNGETASQPWTGRNCEQTYSWYVVVTVGGSSVTSATWTFTCESCNVFTIASISHPTIHLYPPLWNTPERAISKDISRFGFWSDNWAVHDNGIESEPLTLVGVQWVDDDADLSIFHKKFDDIHDIMNNHEEVAISGVTDCIDGYYFIKSFSYDTVKGARRARKWTLNLEYSREKTW